MGVHITMAETPAGLPLLLMWLGMMLAMMMPAAVPLARSYGAAIASAYLGLWAAFAGVLAAVQAALTAFGFFSYEGRLSSQLASAALVTAAGLYQFTPWKHACVAHCRTPVAHLAAQWHAGVRGALRGGAVHGLYCIGCCWLLFAALFALGTMSFAWMAALVAVMLVERHPRLGPPATWLAGLAITAYGLSLFY